jgi:hypothetical protein
MNLNRPSMAGVTRKALMNFGRIAVHDVERERVFVVPQFLNLINPNLRPLDTETCLWFAPLICMFLVLFISGLGSPTFPSLTASCYFGVSGTLAEDAAYEAT